LASLNARQIAEWIAYDQLEPIDPEGRADWRAAMLAATVANYSGRAGKKGRKISDFMPKFTRPRKKSLRELKDMVIMLGKMYGGLKRGDTR
jgi:hypothetical protein